MATIHSFSEIGRRRVNEDAFQHAQHSLDPKTWVVVLADGQGGQRGGERAAKLACQSAMEIALAKSPRELAKSQAWPALLKRVDSIVATDADAGFTTLIGFSVAGDFVYGASSGDSALIGISPNSAVKHLTDGQMKNPPVGSGEAIVVPFRYRLKRPWKLLAMSDGVWKYIGWQPLIYVALKEDGEKLVTELQRLGRLTASGRFQDDFTLVLVQDVAVSPAG